MDTLQYVRRSQDSYYAKGDICCTVRVNLLFPAAFLARLLCGCPCIGEDVIIPKSLRRFTLLQLALTCASDLILSPDVELTRRERSRTRTIYLPAGINERFVLSRKSTDFDEIKVVFVGSLSYRPNMIALKCIMKLASLLPEEVRCEFLVVGGPVPRGFSSNSRVKFLGPLDNGSLLRVYGEANVGILPFFGTITEGPKVKVSEYMAAGLCSLEPRGRSGL